MEEEESTVTGNMNESILLLTPSITTNDEMGEDTDSEDEDYEEDIGRLYHDWPDEID